MLSLLSEKLEGALRKLRGLGKISAANIAEPMQEIRMALLEADVDYQVVNSLIAEVSSQAEGAEVLRSVSPGQMIVKIFHDELVKLLGGVAAEFSTLPTQRVLMVGLNGAGKTTTSAKLAAFLQKKARRPLLIALDLERPAAITQLQVLGQQLGVPVWAPPSGMRSALEAAKAAVQWVDAQGGGVAIFDTAGRQEVDEGLLAELEQISAVIGAEETLLVADAATGQQAVAVARGFQSRVRLSGLVMTRLDGDARGGALLSMRRVTGLPVKFIGVGEKTAQLEIFHPERMASRILGMGDVVSLVEKAAEEIDEKAAMKMAERFEQNRFDFTDFLSQLKMMKRLGPLEGILGMLPGMGALKNMPGVDDKKLSHTEAIILSMTPLERQKPQVLDASRRKRIAAGSGRSVMEVNQLIKQYDMMRQLMGNKGMMAQLAGGLMGGKGGLPPGGMGGFAKMMGPGLKPNKLGKLGRRFKLGG
jgi:signal recognition particle subunit SRP54